MGGTVEVREMTTDAEVLATFPVMGQLRPHLAEGEYVDTIRRMRTTDGYRLAAVLEGREARCVAGFRLCEFLAHGKVLYVDDLVTDEAARSRDHGGRMIRWLEEVAREHDCEQLQLDSGVQRRGAHRFYFREGMSISSFHFAKTI